MSYRSKCKALNHNILEECIGKMLVNFGHTETKTKDA